MANRKNVPPKALLSLLVIALLPILAACGFMDTPMNTIAPKSDVTKDIQTLYEIIFWLAVLVFVVVETGLLYAVIKYRRRPSDGMPNQVHGNRTLEIIWTIVPALVLIAIAVPTWITIFKIDDVPDNSYTIDIMGHQWWWEATYPDGTEKIVDGKREKNKGPVTANEIHVPSNRTIAFRMETADVLHSFWVPQLFGKRDIVPGRVNMLWFTPEPGLEGRFYGQCVEFCGISHANMRLEMIVESPEAFAAWTAGLESAAPAAASGLVQTGYDLFASKGCIACHSISGRDDAFGVIGPNLSLFGDRLMLASATIENNTENLAAWLTDPEAIKPGNIMSRDAPVYTSPDMELSGDEIDALVAYLQNLKN
ncbi:MAG: cytochrome c oxidase subunit II [Chloroflexota bacterium]|nr:cytochrome c oxidase subunit II [Chloroflexota bacterium]